MESYYKEKENIPIASLKRPSQTIKNNNQILKTIQNKLYPLNSVHRQDLYFKKLRKQANKIRPYAQSFFNKSKEKSKQRQERKSLKLITKPNQNQEQPYKESHMEIYKQHMRKNQSPNRNILKQNLEELIRKKSEQSQNLGSSEFKYDRLPKIQREVQLKKQQFIQKAKRQFMEVQFVDRDQRNYSFQYMVKKTELYKKIPSHERSSVNATVYEKYSPNKLKQYAVLLKQQPHRYVKKNGNIAAQSRKLIRLPNSDNSDEQQQKKQLQQLHKKKSKKTFKDFKKEIKIQNHSNSNSNQQNANKSYYKLRVTQNRKKFLDMQQDKKSRSIKYEPKQNVL